MGKMVQKGAVIQYAARPEYKGNSFIPGKIIIETADLDKPGAFNPTINIW